MIKLGAKTDRAEQMGQERIPQLLWRFSVPAVIGMIVNSLYNIVDRIFIGNAVGSLGIAGITIGFPIMMLVMACDMLVSLGAAALISIKLGEGKQQEAEQVMGNAMVLMVFVSLLIMTLGLIFLQPLLQVFGASPDVMPFAYDYMSIIIFATVFMSIGFGMNNFIRAEGNPKVAMYTMLIGAIANIILDPIFIFGFGWGVRGAAIATVIARLMSTTWVLYYFFSGQSVLRLRLPNLRLRPQVALRIAAIGSAPFAMQTAGSIMNLIMNRSLVSYGGDVAVAAMGVVFSASMLIMMPIIGINQGAQPIIGYNYGAQRYDRVVQTLKLAAAVATCITSLGFVIAQLFPGHIIALFNPNDPQLLNLGARAIQIATIFLPIVGFQIISTSYFQAVGKPKQAMILSLSRQVLLLIPLVLILPRFFGLDGLLYSLPLSDLGSSTITAIWITMELKHLLRSQQLAESNA
jgi:putative MATE family efflux protein